MNQVLKFQYVKIMAPVELLTMLMSVNAQVVLLVNIATEL